MYRKTTTDSKVCHIFALSENAASVRKSKATCTSSLANLTPTASPIPPPSDEPTLFSLSCFLRALDFLRDIVVVVVVVVLAGRCGCGGLKQVLSQDPDSDRKKSRLVLSKLLE